MQNKQENGMAHILIIVVMVLVVLVFGVGVYMYLSKGQTPKIEDFTRSFDYRTEDGILDESGEIPISDSDKTTDIERELNSTLNEDIEQDLKDLESEASPL